MGRALLKDGALLTAYSSLLTTVYSTDPIDVNIALAEADVRTLEGTLGKPLAAGASALPARLLLADNTMLDAPGTLDFVAPAVDPANGTVGLRLRFANADGRLRAGQFVRVQLTVRELADALLVPQRALQDLQGKKFVWIADAQSRAQQRDVEPGPQIGADILINKGLAAGDRVIVDGFQRLKADAPVAPAGAKS
jgi:membrane fusion protein (multidrug efflux system)